MHCSRILYQYIFPVWLSKSLHKLYSCWLLSGDLFLFTWTSAGIILIIIHCKIDTQLCLICFFFLSISEEIEGPFVLVCHLHSFFEEILCFCFLFQACPQRQQGRRGARTGPQGMRLRSCKGANVSWYKGSNWRRIFGFTGASLIAQLAKNPPAMQETPVWFLGWEDLLEKGKSYPLQ